MSLKVRLVLLLLAIGLIPVAVVGLISNNIARSNIENEAINKLDLYAGIKSRELHDFFNETAGEGLVMANTRDVYQSLNILQGGEHQGAVIGQVGDTSDPMWLARVAILDNLLPIAVREYGYSFAALTDPKGIVVYSTRPETVGADLSGRDYVQGALAGRQTWSELFFSGVVNENVIACATPVYSKGTGGELVGTYIIVCSDSLINKIIHEGLDTVGRTADAYLVRSDFTLLSDLRLGELSSGAALKEKMVSQATERLVGPVRERNFSFHEITRYINYLGNPVIGSLKVTTLGDEAVGFVLQVDQKEIFAGVNQMRNLMLGIITISIVAIIFLGFLFIKPIIRNVKDSTSFIVNLLAKGDFSVDVPDYAVKLKDEYGDLARGLDTLCRNMRALLRTVVEMATGVNSGAEAVSSTSEEMSASLQEISASTNEFAANATNLSENSQTMAKANARILERAEEGNKAIEKAVNQMQVINNRVRELQQVITEVDRRSNDIGKILGVIADIASQTNLLALNAAIEAARAGEHGRGFAVVAEEVRKLAEQSAEAAKEIGDLITATQEESKKALESMILGVRDVEEGTQVVSQAGNTFGEILVEVKGISKQIEEVASNAEEISAGSEEMAASVEEQTASMEEMAATAQELRASAERLFQELQKFKYE